MIDLGALNKHTRHGRLLDPVKIVSFCCCAKCTFSTVVTVVFIVELVVATVAAVSC